MTQGNYEQRIAALKQLIDTAKSENARAEAPSQMIEQRQREIGAELETLGVKPEDLDAEIARLKAELESTLAEAEGLIPDEMRRQA